MRCSTDFVIYQAGFEHLLSDISQPVKLLASTMDWDRTATLDLKAALLCSFEELFASAIVKG